MAITDYATLAAAVSDYNPHGEVPSKVATWVQLAEARMSRELRCREMTEEATGTLSGAELTLPSDFIETVDFRISTTLSGETPLERRSLSDLLSRYMVASTGLPEAYAIDGTVLRVAPTPDDDYAYTLVYLARIPSLQSAANWLIALAPDLYLYAVLAEGERFLQNPDGLLFWDAQYETARQRVMGADRRARFRGGIQQVRAL